MLAEKIIGVWELQICEAVVDDKVIGYPVGEKASCFIAYHPIGFMLVNISAPNRVRLATDDPFAGDPQLLTLDAKGYLSYCFLAFPYFFGWCATPFPRSRMRTVF